MEETNKHILEKALEHLPQFKAEARIWDKIVQQLDSATQEIKSEILKSAIVQLPRFKSEARIWDKIEQQLDREEQETKTETLKKALKQLPQFKAEGKIWEKIEKGLERKSNFPGSFYPIAIGFLKIAASIIIVIGLSILINNIFTKSSQKELVTFSKETISDTELDVASLEYEEELNDLIKQQCQAQPDICQNPEFTELNQELSDLTQSLDQLKIQFESSGNDPETYKYILRIQKEKAGISKKLLQYFNS